MRLVRVRQKDCIDCGEKISRTAKRCPHCTSFQDGSSGFHASTGQLILLIAVGISAYAAYQASEATRLATDGHISPTLTRLELRNNNLAFDVHNTGNLRAHLKSIAIKGKGYVPLPRSGSGINNKREALAIIEFDFGKSEKRIEARDSITAQLRLRSATGLSVDAAYRSMAREAVLTSFTSKKGGATTECTASISFINPHGAVGSRFTINPKIDCRLVAELIVKLGSHAATDRLVHH